MALSFGFFNSKNHDRKYSALQWSSIFDGLIHDGVYESYGDKFQVKATTGIDLTVGSGRAWFDHTWTLNDTVMPLHADDSDFLLSRIDAVVIEVNNAQAVRANAIKYVKGVPSSSPSKPTLTNELHVHQYPIAFIYRKPGSTVITQSDIENAVGTSACPYVTGIIKHTSIDNLIAQWKAQWIEWFESTKKQFSQQTSDNQSAFDAWFDHVKDKLSTDQAGHLQNQVDELHNDAYSRNEVHKITFTADGWAVNSKGPGFVQGRPSANVRAKYNYELYIVPENNQTVDLLTYAALYAMSKGVLSVYDGFVECGTTQKPKTDITVYLKRLD